MFWVLWVSSSLATPETITSILPHVLGLPLDLGLHLAGPHGGHSGAELQDQLQSLPTPNLASATARAAHLAMPGTACNHWLQQIDPPSKTRVFGLFDGSTTYFGGGSKCNTPYGSLRLERLVGSHIYAT